MRSFRWLAGGIVLYGAAHFLESMGDLAPMAASGVSTERLAWHGMALLVLLAGGACFIRAGMLAWRSIAGRRTAQTSPPEKLVPGAVNAEMDDFDADAALARYLDQKNAEPRPTRPAPGPGGFGKRGL